MGTGGYFIFQTIQSDKYDLTIGFLEGDLHHLAFYVAQDKGFFQELGLTVQSMPFSNGGDVMVDFESNNRKIDMAYLGLAPAIYHRFNNINANIKVVGAVNVNGSALVVRDDNSIQSAEDLKGLKIAVPARHNMQDFILSMILDLADLVHDNISIAIQNVAEMPIALSTGGIDGYLAWEPHCVKGLGNGKYLYNSSEIWANHPCCVIAAHSSFLNSDNETVSKVLQAHTQATDWILSHYDESVALAMEKMNLSQEQAEKAINNIGFVSIPDIDQMEIFVEKLLQLNPDMSLQENQLPLSFTSSAAFIDWFVDLSH